MINIRKCILDGMEEPNFIWKEGDTLDLKINKTSKLKNPMNRFLQGF
jgi:hypothetical protein